MPHAIVYSHMCMVDNDLTLLIGRRRYGETVCTDLEPECQYKRSRPTEDRHNLCSGFFYLPGALPSNISLKRWGLSALIR